MLEPENSPLSWLLDQNPAILWQVMRDLLDAPEDHWKPVRALVETEGSVECGKGRV